MEANKAIILKRYELQQLKGINYQIAYGAFGTVQLAKCLKTKKTVAIKKVNQKIPLEQLQVLFKLSHPNVVGLLNFHYDSNHAHTLLVFQYFEARTLFQYIKFSNLKDKHVINKILHGVCEATSYLKSKQISNLNIKPQNFLLDHKNAVRYCLTSFSLGKMSKLSATRNSFYSAPQIFVDKPITNKTDIWSLGVLFYELLEGKLPYSASSEQDLNILFQNSPVFSKKTAPQMAALVLSMLKINQKQRPQIREIAKKMEIISNCEKSEEISKIQTADQQPATTGKIKLLGVKQLKIQQSSKPSSIADASSARRVTQQAQSPKFQFKSRFHRDHNSFSQQKQQKISLRKVIKLY